MCEQGRQQQQRWHGDGVCANACSSETNPGMRPEVLVCSC